MPVSDNRWRPSVGDLVGIAGFALAVVVYLTQPNWEIGAGVALLAIALIVFAARRHSAHPILRSLVAGVVIVGFIALVWRPISTSFHKDYPRITFNWPITLNPPAPPLALPPDPPDMPPINLPGPALSKWGKAMYLCQFLATDPPQDPLAVIDGVKRNAEIVGNAMGLSMVLNQIAYGFRFDVTANNAEGQLHMGGLQRFTIQIERASQGVFVTTSIDLGALGFLTMMPIDRNSEEAKTWAKVVAQFTGLPENKCRLL